MGEKYCPELAYTQGLNSTAPRRDLASALSAQGGWVLQVSGDGLLVLHPSNNPAQRSGCVSHYLA